jgi:hypothetical protein
VMALAAEFPATLGPGPHHREWCDQPLDRAPTTGLPLGVGEHQQEC